MRISTIILVFGIGLVLFKFAGLGNVAELSWWWVTAPFWGLSLTWAAIVAAALAKVTWSERDRNKGSFADGQPEGWFAEKLRQRRERKFAKWASG